MIRNAAVLLGVAFLMLGISAGAMAEEEAKEAAKVSCQAELSEQMVVSLTAQCNYLLYLPEGYEDDEQAWPLVLFLHGAGERGDDLNRVRQWGPPKLVEEGKQFPFVLVSPQCPEKEWWSSDFQAAVLGGLLEAVIAEHRVDEDRVYVTGLSMGGYGSWRLAAEYPDRIAAIVPICGGGDPESAPRMKDVPVWAFHGTADGVVKPEESEVMVNALNACGGDTRITLYPETHHNSWTATYANPEVYKWLLSHTRKK